MSARTTGSGAAVEALVTGAVTVLWYAMPDVVRSRAVRASLKAGLLAAGGAYAWRQVRADVDEAAGASDASPGPLSDELEQVRALTARPPVLDADVLGLDDAAPTARARWFPVVALGAVAGVVGGTVAVERAIHRFGERLGQRGVTAPHTRIGAVAGAASVLLTLLSVRLEATGRAAAEA